MLIQNNDRFVQPVYFDGMEIGKIHPTDIDSFIEYHNVLFVFWELKEQGKDFEQVRGTVYRIGKDSKPNRKRRWQGSSVCLRTQCPERQTDTSCRHNRC